MKTSSFITLAILIAQSAFAAEYHVAMNGSDKNDGSLKKPFLTITAAADRAQPGDVITVHEGVYRERVNPPRGGESDSRRIVYQAVKGEKVVIKGSEVIKEWKRVENEINVWKMTLPNTFFGSFNPYKELIGSGGAGDWFNGKGRSHHMGEVYLNDKSLFEKATLKEVLEPQPYPDAFDKEASTYTWYCETDDKNTHIWANFHEYNPNEELVEITMRKACFYPDTPGRNYITVRGFELNQAATQWAPPTMEQPGLIGTHWSKGWIIENNVIRNSKCVGLTLGRDKQRGKEHYDDVDDRAHEGAGWLKETIGHHIVRNNTISDCEAAGICGTMGGAFSKIIGNHIYNTQRKRQFVGAETAGIKLHAAIDTLIANNRIHHTDRGIWLDAMHQGTRVTRNVLHDNSSMDVFLEVNHGPYLLDNNLLLSRTSILSESQGGAYVHNLIVGRIRYRAKGWRNTPYYEPHTTKRVALSSFPGGDERYYNNIMVLNGLSEYKENGKFPMFVGGNAYLDKAEPTYSLAAKDFFKSSLSPNIEIQDKKGSLYLQAIWPKGLENMNNQLVTTELLGKSKITDQAFTNPDNSPLTIDTDYFGKKRNTANPYPGPFELTKSGKHVFKVWPVPTQADDTCSAQVQ